MKDRLQPRGVLKAKGLMALGVPITFFVYGLIDSLLTGNDLASVAVFATACVAGACFLVVAARNLPIMDAIAVGLLAGLLSTVAMPYGRYLGYLAGWNGLDLRNFGSDDNPGQHWIVLFVMVWGLPAAIAGALTTCVAATARRGS